MKSLLKFGGWFYILFGGINLIYAIIGIITKQGYSTFFQFSDTYDLFTNLFSIFISILYTISTGSTVLCLVLTYCLFVSTYHYTLFSFLSLFKFETSTLIDKIL